MPFITEELWHQLQNRKEGESIMITTYPTASSFNDNILKQFEEVKNIITNIRNLRTEKNIPFKEKLNLYINTNEEIYKLKSFLSIILKLGNIEKLEYGKPTNTAISFLEQTIEYTIPINKYLNTEEEIIKIEKEIEYYEGFLSSINKKFNNEQFITKAPKNIIENEKMKKNDAEIKLNKLKKQLEQLKYINKI